MVSLSDVPVRLLDLSGGDPFLTVQRRSDEHQREHGCGLHNAGGPQMQLVSALAQAAGASRVIDLGCGLGYSTLWLARGVGPGGTVVGIDDDPAHVEEATTIAAEHGLLNHMSYRTGHAVDVLSTLDGPVDLIHDDAWFASAPEHLDRAIDLLRPGGLYTMVNWFLLIDALTGQPRNDWSRFAGDDWADTTMEYAEQLAARTDLAVTWVTVPPIAFAIKS